MPKQVIRILNCTPSLETQKDWKLENALAAGAVTAGPLPESVDLRESWWGINDQGSAGSCVGWATADSVLRWHFVKAKLLDEDDLLSPRFTWMAAKETDEITDSPTTFLEVAGTSLKAALDISRNYGAVPDDVLPIGSGKLYADKVATFYALAARFKIASYINLERDLDQWKAWLANQGPILTRLEVDTTWDNAKATGGKLDNYNPSSTRGGHAVAFVGYTADRFIVRNSWGTSLWGDKGFGYASYSYAQNAFTEAYGVTI